MNKNDFPISWALGNKTGSTVGGAVQTPENANCGRGKNHGGCTLYTHIIDLPETQQPTRRNDGCKGSQCTYQSTHKS